MVVTCSLLLVGQVGLGRLDLQWEFFKLPLKVCMVDKEIFCTHLLTSAPLVAVGALQTLTHACKSSTVFRARWVHQFKVFCHWKTASAPQLVQLEFQVCPCKSKLRKFYAIMIMNSCLVLGLDVLSPCGNSAAGQPLFCGLTEETFPKSYEMSPYQDSSEGEDSQDGQNRVKKEIPQWARWQF